jgi:carbamate kinase
MSGNDAPRLRIVIALGGNALIRRGEAPTVATQRDRLAAAAQTLAPLARQHELVITHGNGPQVGLLALQAAAYAAQQPGSAPPLDVLDAQSEGMIGYLIEQALANATPDRRFATLLTQVEVDPADPAFAAPSKPIGPPYGAAQAERMARSHGWSFARDGKSWRRVVASPRPLRVLELGVIGLLLEAGVTVVCGGGGGIPVRQQHGRLFGVEAVIDKDHASGLLARQLDADLLLLLTDVPAVARDWGEPVAQWLHDATPASLSALGLPAGSMGPKVQAAIEFVEATGRRAAIGALDDASALVAGTAGTQVHPDAHADLIEAPSQWRLVVEP